MIFGSVCSGIGAPEAAWLPLGWKCSFMSEIEPFPRAVLTHHYAGTPLHHDFTTIEAGVYAPIDLLAGGTPCQSFSVAGLRRGLADDRGNLALEYVLLADRLRPRWLAWENVPGVFSSRPGDEPTEDGEDEDLTGHNGGPVLDDDRPPAGSDFAAFLSALVRWEVPIPEGGWRNGGIIAPAPVDGAYGVAWGVLDAQYFGVPQRRRRVFVVGYIGDWRPAAAVLFERYCLQGHPPPRREPGKGSSAPTAPSLTASGRCVERAGETRGQDPVVAVELGRAEYLGNAEGGAPETPFLTHSNLGKHVNNQTPLVEAPYSIMPMNSGKDYVARQVEVAQPLMGAGPTSGNQGGDFVVREAIGFNASQDPDAWTERSGPLETNGYTQAVAFDTTQITHPENRSNPQPGDPCHPLAAQGHPPAIAFSVKDHGGDAEYDLSPTLRAGGYDKSHANGGVMPAIAYVPDVSGTVTSGAPFDRPGNDRAQEDAVVAYGIRSDATRAGEALTPSADAEGRVRLRRPGMGVYEELAPTLDASQPHAVAFALRGRDDGAQPEVHDEGDSVGALRAADGGSSRDYVAFTNAGHFGGMGEAEVGDPLRAKGGDTGNGGETIIAIPLLEIGKGTTSRGKGPNGAGIGEDGDPMFTLQAGAQHGIATSEPFAFKASHFTRDKDGAPSDVVPPLSADADKGDQDPIVCTSAVRRLTPEECEALQDFPRHYTRIAWGGKPAELCPDGPRYRALGNSMCRKVMVYLGERIQAVDQIIRGEQ